MDKLSNFFKNHPLLALFLTSVITICCINFAITVQSKRFSDTAPEDMNTWTFEDRTSELAPSFRGGEESETAQTALSDLTEPFEQQNQQFSHTVEKPVTQDDIFTLGDPEESAEFDLVSNTVSEPSPAGEAVTDGLESVQAPSAETAVSENAADFFAEEEETVSLTDTHSDGMTESAEVTGGDAHGARSSIVQAVCSPIRNPMPRGIRMLVSQSAKGLVRPMRWLAAANAA